MSWFTKQDAQREANKAKAWMEFTDLPGVSMDPSGQTTIANLLDAAQFEVDHFYEGESELTQTQVTKIKKFIKAWEGKA